MDAYTALVGKVTLEYSLNQATLRCRSTGEAAFTYEVNLEDENVRIEPYWKLRMQFKLGLVGVVVPLWTFGAIYLKNRTFDFFDSSWATIPHYIFFAVGVTLLIAYRRPNRGLWVLTAPKTGLVVWRDLEHAGEFEVFTTAVRARAGKNA